MMEWTFLVPLLPIAGYLVFVAASALYDGHKSSSDRRDRDRWRKASHAARWEPRATWSASGVTVAVERIARVRDAERTVAQIVITVAEYDTSDEFVETVLNAQADAAVKASELNAWI